jgi:hypothetical protein
MRIDDLLPATNAADDSRTVRRALALFALVGAVGVRGDTLEAGSASPAAFDAEPIARRPGDVVDYTLHATLDPKAHTIHGEGTIVWRNTSAEPARELWMHLYMNAFKNTSSDYLSERVGGRGSAAIEDWGWIDVRKLTMRRAGGPGADLWATAEVRRGARRGGEPEGPASDTAPSPVPSAARRHPDANPDDETDARVPLPDEVAPGASITLDMVFDEKLPAVVERTGYSGSFHMVGQWFPKIARLEPSGVWAHFPFHHLSEFYADFGSYDVTLDVPERYTLGATGPVVESMVANGRRVERHVQRDVHDFAWTAWDDFVALHDTIDGVRVTLLHPPGFGAVARRELEALRFALPYFSARYGPYPYDVLTVVHPPDGAEEAGGMEYPTLITSEGAWWEPAGVREPELVTIHELGHQWFYGMVATDEHAWPLLDEGLNQFAEVDAMAKWLGPGSLVDLAGLKIGDAEVQAVGGNAAVHDEPVAQAADAFSTGGNYGRLVYSRTAAVLETVARVYGQEATLHALGVYARRYRFAHPVPDDLLRVFHETMGPRVAETLRAAFFDEGWVDYAVDDVWTQESERAAGVFDREGQRATVDAGTSDEGGWDSSVLVRRRGTLSFPVDVELMFADGSTRRERWDGEEARRRFTWHGPSALVSAVVDPDGRLLVDGDLGNNFGAPGGARRALSVRPAAAPRTLERAAYWMQLALEAVSP